ncbi:MAG: filamentous hemagglutinin family outer membrane protein [Moraxellaceae bacterium]|nr:filamentous hemagglutinin family outer membrane protein [Moraxellaceae bacterium]
MRHAARHFRRNALSAAILTALAGQSLALPQGGSVTAGSGAITTSGSNLTVHQGTQKLIVDWQSFGIAGGEHVQFVQPSASAVALNRVLGNNASEIYGSLSANGQVFLINPNGILFGPTAQVSVGSLVASTLDIGNDDFLAGNYVFDGEGGRVANQGTLTAAEGGVIALLAPEVRNEGVIVAQAGGIGLGAGTRVRLELAGGLSLDVEESALNALIENRHALRAEGGTIILAASAQRRLLTGMINNTGTVVAGSAVEEGGVIRLIGGFQSLGGTLDASGTKGGGIAIDARNVDQYGRIDAQGTAGDGGTISLTGERLIQTSAAVIDASGSSTGGDVRLALGSETGGAFLSGTINANGGSGAGGDITLTGADLSLVAAHLNANGESGGQIRIGGDYQGANPELVNARTTTVNTSSVIRADATAGDGGRVIVWSDEATTFNGHISARAGDGGGNGGFVEVSGKEALGFAGDVDVQAPNGSSGTVLLDPRNITISAAGTLPGFQLQDPNAAAGNAFGATATVVGSGKLVVTSRGDDFVAPEAGAVYLFDTESGALLSTLRGSAANDRIGDAVTVLTNGNYVIRSAGWDYGAAADAGAITWGSGTSGINGIVGAGNSLVGASAGDKLGSFMGVQALNNGNYVITSPLWDNGSATDAGAVTWGNGATGSSGVVSAANSFVGSTANDQVGASNMTFLANGSFVLVSALWDRGAIENAGAVTWVDGTNGGSGVIGAGNSLVGSHFMDMHGSSIAELNHGNFVVRSWGWDNGSAIDAGAATWGSSTSGVSGVVGPDVSLVGTAAFENVGQSFQGLSNGSYYLSMPTWDNGAVSNVGAVTWGDGASGVRGVISASNSLIGSTDNDRIGVVLELLHTGNFLVGSTTWDNGSATDAGAIAWVSGTAGAVGVIGAGNALVGSTSGDRLGSGNLIELSNGSYVVGSGFWDNGSATDAGAVTWGSGSSGVTGVVSASNSLVGSSNFDYVGGPISIDRLQNGNYVVASSSWSNGSATDAGAVTWGNGTTGTTGVISASNSLVGSSTGDQIGSDVVWLANGNYVAMSSVWDNGSAVDAGAITWGSGTGGVTGVVSAANSLVGSSSGDELGNYGIVYMPGSNYLIRSANWDNGSATDAGAVTWGSGTAGVSGVLGASNSLVGESSNDRVGVVLVDVLGNGNFVVRTPTWDNGGAIDAGAVSFGSNTTGISGVISASNSLVGTGSNNKVGSAGITRLANGNFIVGSELWDNGSVTDAGASTWASGTSGITGEVSASNSLVGTSNGDKVGASVTALTNGNYVVRSSLWDNGAIADAGAVTWGNGSTGLSGAVSVSNSLVGSQAGDFVGVGGLGITALPNGNYVVGSQGWDNGSAVDAGAVTWGNGTTGITGEVSAANSLVGSSTNDKAGFAGMLVLPSGNFIAITENWDNGTATDAGAMTWVNGTTGLTGTINAANSLVGGRSNDRIGSGGVRALANGHYLVNSYTWDNGSAVDAGAVTWGSGTSGVRGVVSAGNSLVGTHANDNVGTFGSVTSFANGDYLVLTPTWDNGAIVNAGAVTVGTGATGIAGGISYGNSLIGLTSGSQVGSGDVTPLANGSYVIQSETADGAGRVDILDIDGSFTYAQATGHDLVLHPDALLRLLHQGAAVTLQASNDITVNAALIASNAADAGGDLTLQAGRSLAINAAIDTDGGDLTLIANDLTANGVVAADRAAGPASLSINGTVDAGSGDVRVTLRNGQANAGGGIVINGAVTANTIAIRQDSGSGLVLGGTLTSTQNSGTGIEIVAPVFTNLHGNGALSSATGSYWRVWTASPVLDDRSGQVHDFKQYNANYGTSTVLGSGNGFLYSLAPVLDLSTLSGNPSRVYDGTNVLTGVFDIDGEIDSDTVQITSTVATYADKNAGTGKAVTLGGTLVVDGRNGDAAVYGYQLTGTLPALTGTITPKAVDVTGIAVFDKVYDATTAAALDTAGVLFSGVIAGDDLAVDVAATQAQFADKNVGTSKTVSISGLLLTGAEVGNYTLSAASTTSTASIIPKAISASGITADNKVYDATTAATLATTSAALSGVFAGDAVGFDFGATTAEFADKNVGSGKTVTVSGTALAGSDAGNYSLDSYTTTATITPRAIDVSGPVVNDKVYDGSTAATLSTAAISLTGLVAGDALTLDVGTASAAFADKNVGSHKAVSLSGLALVGADAGNYSLNPYSTTASITPKALAVSGITAFDKVYDATTAVVLDVSTPGFSGFIAGDDAALNVGAISGEFADRNVGSGKSVVVSGFALSGADAGNYLLDPYSLTASITPKAIAATGIVAQDKVYDGTTAAQLSSTLAGVLGVIGSDAVALATDTAIGAFGDKSAGSGKSVAVSGLVLTGADAGNYTLGAYTATASITPKAIAATGLTANDKVYDGTLAAMLTTGSAGLTGIVTGDTLSLATGSASGTFGDKNVGSGKTVTVSGLALTGSDAGNYSLDSYSTTATITAKSVSATGITANDKVYDSTTAAILGVGSAALSGMVAGDVVALSVGAASGSFADKHVGTSKAVGVSGLALTGTDAGNYVLASYSTSASITPLAINASGITAANKIYDGTLAAMLGTGSGTLSGVLGSDRVSLAAGVAAGSFADKNVGSGKTVTVSGLALTGSDAGNYSLNSYSTTANITAKSVSATGVTANDKVYDGSTMATLGTSAGLSGAVAGDNVLINAGTATGSFGDRNVGNDKIVSVSGLALTGTDAGNYTLASYSTTADITPRGLTASGITASDKVYDGTTLATLDTGSAAVSGMLGGDAVSLDAGSATGTFSDKNVGIAKSVSVASLLLTGADAGNYTLASYSTSADITPKSLTVVVKDAFIYTGQPVLPAIGYALDGLVPGDGPDVVSGVLLGIPDHSRLPPGFYEITVSGGVAANYTLAYTSGTLEVNPGREELAHEAHRDALATALQMEDAPALGTTRIEFDECSVGTGKGGKNGGCQ